MADFFFKGKVADFIINKLFRYRLDWVKSRGCVYVSFFFFCFSHFAKRQGTINTVAVLFMYCL